MTWTKLSDDYGDDCWTLSDAAFRLHTEGLVWSNRKLLDCRIPKDQIRHLKRFEAVDELLAVGWWNEDGDVYVIRHHAIYQRTREAVLVQQAKNKDAGRQGGIAKARAARRATSPETAPPSEVLSEVPSDSLSKRDRPGLDRTAPTTSTDETEFDVVAKAKASWGIQPPEPEPDDLDRALSVVTTTFPGATVVSRTG